MSLVLFVIATFRTSVLPFWISLLWIGSVCTGALSDVLVSVASPELYWPDPVCAFVILIVHLPAWAFARSAFPFVVSLLGFQISIDLFLLL